MPARVDIVVAGCINSDLVAFVSRLPTAGETVFSHALDTHFGGKGANQAAQAALLLQSCKSTVGRIGHECAFGKPGFDQVDQLEKAWPAPTNKDVGVSPIVEDAGNRDPVCGVAMVGRVGRDAAGASFLRHFSSLSIDTSGVSVDPCHPTGTALVTVAEGGENTIAYMPAANALMDKEHVAMEPILSLLRNAKVVVSENGIPGSASVACFRIAKEANPHVLTVFTPAPVDCVDREICCFTDFLLCNIVEARALLEMWGGDTVPSEPEDETAVSRLLHDAIVHTATRTAHGVRGLANVVITRGSQPCVVFANGKVSLVPLAQHIPSELVVDTTGAGDSFAGSFAYFLLLTPGSPEIAVSRATFVAAQSVIKKGAAESYASRNDLPDHLFLPQ